MGKHLASFGKLLSKLTATSALFCGTVASFCFIAAVQIAAVQAEEPIREFVDITGKHTVTAKYLKVVDGQVHLEKEGGDVIKLPLNRLSEADQKYVNALLHPNSHGTADPENVVDERLLSDKSALAAKAKQILTDACYSCHGEQGSNEGGFNFVLHVQRMTDGDAYISPGNPDDSYLYERIDAGDMPPEDDDVKFSKADAQTLKAWIEAGAPDFVAKEEIEFISRDDLEVVIFQDLETLEMRERKYQRYFTLVHLYNAGTSQDELETYRKALSKLINSLSWNSKIVIPIAINQSKTILRLDLRSVNWTPETWDHLLSGYPYGYLTKKVRGDVFEQSVNTRLPFIRADWFVAIASTPPLYHTLLQIPDTDSELEKLLRINVANNIASDEVVRAGFNRSGVSQNNRMIERHETPYGGYWKSYDFAGSAGQQNLFDHPLGPGEEEQDFAHDGGEMIFTLPNGLNGYMLTDASGDRLDAGPTQIVSDPGRQDKTVVNGISCMSCHYAGMIEKQDEIRTHVEKFPNSYPRSGDILAKYPGQFEMNMAYRKDATRFAQAMSEIGIQRLTKSGEPISNMSRRFESELDINLASAELGVNPQQFDSLLRKSATLARSLGPLTHPGGTMKRDAFVQIFLDAVAEFELGIGIPPEEGGGFRTQLAGAGSSSSNDDPGEYQAIIAKLTSANSFDWRQAIDAIKLNPPKRPNGALTAAVANVAKNGRSYAVEALDLLIAIDPKASKGILLEMIEATDDSGYYTRRPAFKALAKLKDPKTVDAISKHLDGRNKSEAIEALVAIGEPSEQAIIDRLEIVYDSFIEARPLINALGKVGTEKSLGGLKTLSRNKSTLIARDAATALREIEQRLKK